MIKMACLPGPASVKSVLAYRTVYIDICTSTLCK